MLDPSADEIRDWGNSVIELMADYLGDLRDRGVYRHMSSREIRGRLDGALPAKGTDFDGLLKVFRETIIPFSRQNAHPRMFAIARDPARGVRRPARLNFERKSDGVAFRAGAGGTRAPNDRLDSANPGLRS